LAHDIGVSAAIVTPVETAFMGNTSQSVVPSTSSSLSDAFNLSEKSFGAGGSHCNSE
jgi:hypothetical protein